MNHERAIPATSPARRLAVLETETARVWGLEAEVAGEPAPDSLTFVLELPRAGRIDDARAERLSMADVVLVPHEDARRALIDSGVRSPVMVWPAPSLLLFREDGHPPVIGHVIEADPHLAGTDLLLEAFRLLDADARLVITGPAEALAGLTTLDPRVELRPGGSAASRCSWHPSARCWPGATCRGRCGPASR